MTDVQTDVQPMTSGDGSSGVAPPAVVLDAFDANSSAVQDAGSRAVRPDDVGSSVVQPADAGSGVVQPDDVGSSVVQPADAGSGAVQPTGAGQGDVSFADSHSSLSADAQPMTSAQRGSGVAPLAVVFDAIGSGSGVVQPGDGDFAGLHYVWSFADPTSGTWATSGKSKNLGIGFVASHVFEKAGTYRVTLEVTDTAGAKKNYYQDITVQDPETTFSGKTYYMSSSGSDSNNGLSESAPFKTWSKGTSVLFGSAGPRRLLLKRGESWTSSANPWISNATGPYMIGAYGTGANPKLNGDKIDMGGSVSDVRICDIDFAGSADHAIMPGQNTLVMRCSITGYDACVLTDGEIKSNNFFVDCSFLNGSQYGMYYAWGKHLSVLGCTFDNSGMHLLRTYITNSVIAHSKFSRAPVHHIKLCASDRYGQYAQNPYDCLNVIVADNYITPGTVRNDWMVSFGPENNQQPQYVENVVIERNTFDAAGFDSMIGMESRGANKVTIRNNRFVNINIAIAAGDGMPGFSTWNDWQIYNNSQIQRDHQWSTVFVTGGDFNNLRIRNNICSRANDPQERPLLELSGTLSGITESNNIWYRSNTSNMISVNGQLYSLSSWQSAGKGAGTRAVDPKYVSATDLHPQTSSPALGAGMSIPQAREDCDNKARPSTPDIGAYEQ